MITKFHRSKLLTSKAQLVTVRAALRCKILFMICLVWSKNEREKFMDEFYV